MTRTIEMESRVADIALQDARTVPVLERYKVDYCCGGGRSLGQAAQDAGLDAAELITALRRAVVGESPEPQRDWTTATMTELADHIVETHHHRMREWLERLAFVVPKVAKAHGKRQPELVELQDVVKQFSEEMYDHMIREERVVFPWLRRLDRMTEIHKGPPWSVKRPISCMIHDHDDAASALQCMRRLTGGYSSPDWACATYRSMISALDAMELDTHIHISKENNILFPAGIAAEERLAHPATGDVCP